MNMYGDEVVHLVTDAIRLSDRCLREYKVGPVTQEANDRYEERQSQRRSGGS